MPMIRTHEVRAGALAFVMCAMAASATAAETITLYAAGSLKSALTDLAESYERTTGNTVSAKYGASPPIWSILRPCMSKTRAAW